MTMTIATVVNVLFAYTEVLHNSMLIRAAGLKGAHAASGLALSLGNFASVVALGFTAWAFALPGKVHWAWVPAAPLFGLNPATHEPERVVAILSAVILAIGAIPIFLFTPDAPKTGVPALKAFKGGERPICGACSRRCGSPATGRGGLPGGADAVLRRHERGAVLLRRAGGRGDALGDRLDLLLTGIILSVVAVFGGMVGRWLDHNLGPKRALQIEIFMTILGLTALLGTTPTHIFYFWPYDAAAHGPLWNGPVYRTLPDLMYLLIGFNNAIFITGQYASSRTALTRLTPPAQTGAFFGVYALAGVATAWLAPGLVNIGTRVTHSQQGGFASIILLLAVGLFGLMFVKGGGTTPPPTPDIAAASAGPQAGTCRSPCAWVAACDRLTNQALIRGGRLDIVASMSLRSGRAG